MGNLFILTLTWNKIDKLGRLKESLIPALKNINYSWFIKDNASKDNTFEIASEWGQENKNINVIKYKDNLQNFSEGMNYLFNVATPKDNDFVLLLNNDVIFNDTTSINNMISLMKGNVGIVGAKLLFTGTNRLQHAGVVFTDLKLPKNYRNGENDDESSSRSRYFQAVTGAVMLTTAGIYRNICTNNKSGIQGFDEMLVWSFDDVDACLSVKYNLKKDIVYCGKTNIFHDESASLKINPVNRLFLNKNSQYFLEKWRKVINVDFEKYGNKNFNIIK